MKCDASTSRHGRLTNSPARTNMLLLIRRSVRLVAAALDGLLNILHSSEISRRSKEKWRDHVWECFE
ncbi:MAG: hypothetical protein K0S79_290 [Nitrospira sp.]|jgi:hypothetical protein|nr:hypothetical protein [Nitrospira sp.]